jgi:molecular chaperone GrpE (heat shock protein)
MEKEFEDEWRKFSASAKNVNVDIQRLEMEVAEFERESTRLQKEREQFPTTTLRAYLKKLLPFLKI